MISAAHFRDELVRPLLARLGMTSKSAVELLVGTALAESRLTFLRQEPAGPARGFYQIEIATARDIVDRYLQRRLDLRARVIMALGARLPKSDREFEFRLISDLGFQTAIARLKYWTAPERLPPADDIDGLALYWKQHFNTPAGAGRPEDFVRLYRRFAND